MTQPNPRLSSLFKLEYPQSVGVYDSYVQAQAAVDFLADAKFAVQNLAIVGTDLKSVERVTGRRNWGTVMVTGLQSGLSTGLMVTFILWFLQPQANPLVLLPGALLIGILIGCVFAGIGYASSRGRRDFNSVSQTVAAKYEVLCEHKVAAQARELIAGMPGARAAQFDPRTPPPAWNAPPYQGSTGPQPHYPGQTGAQYSLQPQHPGQAGAQYSPQPQFPGQPSVPQAAPAGPYPAPSQPQPGGQGAGTQQPAGPQPGPAPVQQTSGDFVGRPYGEYGRDEGIGNLPAPEQDGRTPRGDN